jgi:prepilin-type N-terminal cleavage/methylation domain-containing protein
MNKSFTLIEILVVIVVIGILSAFILVGTNSISDKAHIAKGLTFTNSIRNSLLMNLVSEWKLDGNANDSWGNQNGSLNGSPSPSNDCVINTCYTFNGSSQYVSIPHPTGIDVFNFGSYMSAFIWAKGSAQQSRAIFASYDSGANKRAWRIRTNGVDTAKISVNISSTGSNPDEITSDNNVVDNRWHLMGFTFSSGILKLYIDSTVKQITASASTIYDAPDGSVLLSIGCNFSNGTASEHFAGQIDEAKLYNQAVSSFQAKEIYYSGVNMLFIHNLSDKIEYNNRIVELKQSLVNNN